MKFLSFFLALVLVFSGTFMGGYAHAYTTLDEVSGVLANAGLENGKSKWTASGGSFSVITSTSGVGSGKVSGQFTCSASGQFVETALATVPNSMVGNACLTNLKVKDAQGVKVVVRDASASLAEYALTTADASWKDLDKSVNYTCPSQVRVRLECTSATGAVKFDDVYAGKNNRIVNIEESSPVGTVIASMLTEAQFQAERGTHWVLADGRTVAGTKFASLFGSTTLPDLRGTFLRGKDHGRGLNPDGNLALGVYSADKFTSHTHSLTFYQDNGNGTTGRGNPIHGQGASNARTDYMGGAGGNETAPKSITVNYFIKIDDVNAIKSFTDTGYALRAGQVITVSGPTCPVGTLPAEGQALERAKYPELFANIGTANGDGTTQGHSGASSGFGAGVAFNLPNYAGKVLRGHANGNNSDPDRAGRGVQYVGGASGDNVGSYQGDMYQSHSHMTNTEGYAGPFGNETYSSTAHGVTAEVARASLALSSTRGGNETRMKNVNVKFCVQLKDTNIVGSFKQIDDLVTVKNISSLTAYTATSAEGTIYTTSGVATLVTLPLANTVPNKIFTFVNGGTALLQIQRSGSETIDGRTTFMISPRETVVVQSTGSGYIFLNNTNIRNVSFYKDSAGVVYSETIDAISGNCSVSASGGWSCNFTTSALWSANPICTTETDGGATNGTTMVTATTHLGGNSWSGGAYNNSGIYISCSGLR